MRLPRLGFPILGAVLGSAIAWSAQSADLAPHRALYDMRLSFTDSIGSSISGARGAMSYEFRDACEGWTAANEVYLRLQRGEGPELESVRKMVTWEAKDGLGFRFRISESQGGQLVQEIKGVAAIDATGKEGVAEFTHPKALTVKLPAGTLFPSAHIVAMIEGRGSTGRHLGKVVFDGTTLDNPYEVSALLNTRPSGAKYSDRIAAMLSKTALSSARLAYYPLYKKDEVPEFELVVDYRPDGIVSRLLQDFGDYGIEARLQQLEMLPLDKC